MTLIRRLAKLILLTGLCAVVGAGLATQAYAQRVAFQQQPRRAPAPPAGAFQRRGGPGPNARAPRGEHLADWMNQHRNLSPAEQQSALEKEPGFHELPVPTQQRMHDRLAQLNAMTPEKRQRVIERNEHMEQLTPDQRGQVRGAMEQLGSLPPEERRVVARNFRALRDLPPNERAAAMGRMPLNDAQRATLGNLMRVEPLMPPPEPPR